jgi:hypothetical protein
MASGDLVINVKQIMPPATSYATMDIRPGGSTPAENNPVYDFDASASEYLDFLCLLDGYDGGGLTITLPWSASSATTGDVRWEAAIRRYNYDGEDVDPSHSYDFNGVTDTAPGTSGHITNPTITFTDGADMDSWADGELAIVRVYRDHDHADDDMAGDAELWGIVGKET